MAKDTLTPGSVLSEDLVVVANVRVDGGYVPADAAPWGSVVTRTVMSGELVPSSALTDAGDVGFRPVAVESSLPLAGGIVPGAVVDVWLTHEGAMGTESVLVGAGLVVDEVDHGSGSFSQGAETVYVLVPSDDVGDLLSALAGAEEVAVVGMPGREGS
jgi:hypothetical protein